MRTFDDIMCDIHNNGGQGMTFDEIVQEAVEVATIEGVECDLREVYQPSAAAA